MTLEETLREYNIVREIDPPPPGWEREESGLDIPYFHFDNIDEDTSAVVTHVNGTELWEFNVLDDVGVVLFTGKAPLLKAMVMAEERITYLRDLV